MSEPTFKETDIISTYTVDQAVSDGFIHKLGNAKHRVTDNLFCTLQKENNSDIGQTLNHILCELCRLQIPLNVYLCLSKYILQETLL